MEKRNTVKRWSNSFKNNKPAMLQVTYFVLSLYFETIHTHMREMIIIREKKRFRDVFTSDRCKKRFHVFLVRRRVFGASGDAVTIGIRVPILLGLPLGCNGCTAWKPSRTTRRRFQTLFRPSTTIWSKGFQHWNLASM